MRIGSLFSGIGGLEMGLEAAIPGAYTVWQVEQAEYPRRVLAKHWPDTRRYTDVCMVHRAWDVPGTGAIITQPLAAVDLICGGFPCQDISTAGKGAGLSGSRSGLWFEYLRIIRALRPRWVVVENVAALRRRGLGAVLWGLADLGYNAEWSMLSAADVGAPHLRKRLFIIASLPNSATGGDGEAIAGVDGEAEHVANGDGRGCEEFGLPQPAGLERSRGGLVDRCGQDGELDNAEAMGDSDDAGRGQQRGRVAVGTTLAAVECSSVGRTQPRVGRAPDGLSAWTYRGTDPEAWEQGIARAVEARTVPDRSARLRALGNAVVPQCAYEVGLRVRSLMEES
jgi:DNA (cytosine-5)-methyltransferase 1